MRRREEKGRKCELTDAIWVITLMYEKCVCTRGRKREREER